MDDRPAPRHVLEEAVAEPGPAVGTLDQAWEIRENEAATVLVLHDAEMRLQRGERVVGDLGTGPGETGDQGALSGVGKADQAHVREQAQLESDPLFLAFRSRLREPGRLQGGRGEVHVPEPAPATLGQHPTAVVLAQVREHLAARDVAHQGARRHPEDHLGRRMPVLVAAAARLAVPRPVFALEAEVEQRGQALVRLEDDVASVSPVAARGAATRDELLPPEGNGSRAAVAGPDEHFRFIDELHGTRRPRCPAGSPRAAPRPKPGPAPWPARRARTLGRPGPSGISRCPGPARRA